MAKSTLGLAPTIIPAITAAEINRPKDTEKALPPLAYAIFAISGIIPKRMAAPITQSAPILSLFLLFKEFTLSVKSDEVSYYSECNKHYKINVEADLIPFWQLPALHSEHIIIDHLCQKNRSRNKKKWVRMKCTSEIKPCQRHK